jgi:RNA polymerase subunit RPABC4/transcription elongation factor Spt4
MGAWVTASVVFLLALIGLNLILSMENTFPFALQAFIPILMASLLAAYIIAVGYVYGDARRRGMRYVMWTLLAIFVPNCIGIVLYFILRDPLPIYCSSCGAAMQQNHAFCPVCGRTATSACPSCHRATQPGWTHCAWCGAKLSRD